MSPSKARPAGAARRFWARNRTGYLFAGPYLAGLLLLLAGPLVLSLLLSFTGWTGLGLPGAKDWVGLENYQKLLAGRDYFFNTALANTVIYAVFAVPLGLLFSLALALLLNRHLPAVGIFRTIFYLPHVVTGVATVLMWRWFFHPDLGPLNNLLRGLGFSSASHPMLGWLSSPEGAKPALIVMSLWGAGGSMLIFLAALQNVPGHLYEAARVDGAGHASQFLHITLPQISPAVFFNLVMGIIGALQVFMQPFLLYSKSQQGDALLMAVMQIYYEAFSFQHFGYASAMAWVLFVLIFALTVLVLLTGKLWVYYESES